MFKKHDEKNPYLGLLPALFQYALLFRYWRAFVVSMAFVGQLVLSNSVRAEFETVIDSPATVFEEDGAIESNTQVNLYPGGVLPGDYTIGPTRKPGNNIEINLLGGSIGTEEQKFYRFSTTSWRVRTTNVTLNLVEGEVWGDIDATVGALVTLSNANVNGSLDLTDGSLALISGGQILEELSAKNGSVVRMSGGTIGASLNRSYGASAYDGSAFLMSGGTINGALVVSDSYANITGGRIERALSVSSNGSLEISGGSTGPISVSGGGKATLIGGEFQLDGNPIEGLGSNAQSIDLPKYSILTGVLSDGTPIAVSNTSILQGYFEDGKISLQLAPVVAPVAMSGAPTFNAPNDPIPFGLRTGQSILLRDNAVALANFTALPSSTVSISGGEIGRRFQAVGATVTLTEGSIGELSTIYKGTTLKVSGGVIGSNLTTAPGSRLEVSGGKIGSRFVAHPDSEVIYSGGKFISSLKTMPNSSFAIAGGEFKINGTPINALATLGATEQIDLPEHGVLSGTLSDGTSFAFGGNYPWFAPGTLTLQATDIPEIEPAIIQLPRDPVPQGLRSGQTLLLAEGGDLGDDFTADAGSVIRMSGGHIGNRFRALGSFVHISGGEVTSMKALFGTLVNMDGGSVKYYVSVERGAIFNFSGGELKRGMYLDPGGRVNVSGGLVEGYIHVSEGSTLTISGGEVTADTTVYEGAVLSIEGGTIRDEISVYRGTVNISGGRLGDGLYVYQGGHARLSGADFRIDGVPISIETPGRYTDVVLPQDSVLSGVFSDGTPFAFTSSDGDILQAGTLQISTSSFLPATLGSNVSWSNANPLKGLLPSKELTLAEGESIGANFTAGWESSLTIDGGEIGDNFEAVGAIVTLREGSIGNDMDVLFGTKLNVEGGTIGRGLQAHRGSIVNISGGTVSEISARSGSTINLIGGSLGRVSMEAGSEIHIMGNEFLLNRMPIEGFNLGDSIVLDWDDIANSNSSLLSSFGSSLSAVLLDGSPFTLSESFSLFPPNLLGDWESGGPVSIRLTYMQASLQVPEPSSFAMIAFAILACAKQSGCRRRWLNTLC